VVSVISLDIPFPQWYISRMPRPPRIEYPDAIYHVTARGIEGRMIVMDDKDRAKWLERLEHTVDRHGWRVFAFALLGNHFHLFLQTPKPNLAAGMRDLSGGHVAYFNARHGRKGHLFQSRYKAYIVEDEGYWQELSRYVHLNPVRAGLAEKPEDWRWSSYAGYHRQRLRRGWVDYGRVLEDFGGDSNPGRQRCREYMEDGLGRDLDSPFERAVHGFILGSDRLVERIEKMLDSGNTKARITQQPGPSPRELLAPIILAVARHYGIDPAKWVPGRRCDHPARRVAASLAHRFSTLTSAQIAEALGYRNMSSVSTACRSVSDAPKRSDLAKAVHAIEKSLTTH